MKRMLFLCFAWLFLLCSCTSGKTESIGGPVSGREDLLSGAGSEGGEPVSEPTIPPEDTRSEIMIYGTKRYGEQIAQMKRKTVDGKEKTCIELYDPRTNETTLFLSRDEESEEGTTDVAANFAVCGEDVYLFIQKYTPVYNEQSQVIDMEWTAWTVEQYNREEKLVAEFSCEAAKSYFTSNAIAQFYVWGDYLYFASWGEGALFKIEDQSLSLTAKTAFLSDFFPAIDLEQDTPGQILFSAYSHYFFLFEPQNQSIRVIDYPLKESEKIVSSFVSGENVCFEVWDTQENAYGNTAYHCYLSSLEDLLAYETQCLDLSAGSVLDLDLVLE